MGSVRSEGIPEGEVLSVVGGDILSQGHMLAAAGAVKLVSVASFGEVRLGALDLLPSTFDQLGTIRLLGGSLIDSSGVGGGEVVIRGGRLEMQGPDARIRSFTLGARAVLNSASVPERGTSSQASDLSGTDMGYNLRGRITATPVSP